MGLLYCFSAMLCVGLSTGSFPFPLPILPLQVKNVSRAHERELDLFSRSDWELVNGSLQSVYNDKVSLGALGDNADIGIRGQGPIFRSVRFVRNRLRVGDKCVTAAKCVDKYVLSEGRMMCDPSVKDFIERKYQLKRGAFLKLLPCLQVGHVSQTLTEYRHNCTMEKLSSCHEDCKVLPFHVDDSYCVVSHSPSREPTFSPEPPLLTDQPSTQPSSSTSSPSMIPSYAPTIFRESEVPTPSVSPTWSDDTSPSPAPSPAGSVMTVDDEDLSTPSIGDQSSPYALASLAVLVIPIGVITAFIAKRFGG